MNRSERLIREYLRECSPRLWPIYMSLIFFTGWLGLVTIWLADIEEMTDLGAMPDLIVLLMVVFAVIPVTEPLLRMIATRVIEQ